MTITEPGPVGVFAPAWVRFKNCKPCWRNQAPPSATQVGAVNANATLTTAMSIANVQGLLASTPGVGYDIIPLVAPPGSYTSAVNKVFQTTNTGGTAIFDRAGSGALLEGGADTLNSQDLDAFYYYNYIMKINVPTPSAGTGGVGRTRISENGTTTPQDRVFLDYGFFDRVGLVSNRNNLNRFVPGFEKTFFQGRTSVEVRIPMACTVNSNIPRTATTARTTRIWATSRFT